MIGGRGCEGIVVSTKRFGGGYVSGGPVAETGENSGRGRRMNVLNSVDEPKNGEQWKWWDGRKVGGLRWFHLRESELGR